MGTATVNISVWRKEHSQMKSIDNRVFFLAKSTGYLSGFTTQKYLLIDASAKMQSDAVKLCSKS